MLKSVSVNYVFRIRVRLLLVNSAWWTWQEVSAPAGQGPKVLVYVKQVCYLNTMC